MRFLKKILIILVLGTLVVPMLSCDSDSDEAELPEYLPATVQRGDITVEITAAGNLALSRTEDLAIDLFYQEGTVAEVLVEEGDTVEEGQVLVKLDADEWDDQIATLEDAVTTAERQVTAKERALTAAEHQVTALERQVTAKEVAVTEAEREVVLKEFAVRQAQLALETAESNLMQINEVKAAQDAVDDAELFLEIVEMGRSSTWGRVPADYAYWDGLKTQAESELAAAQANLQEILDRTSTTLPSDVALDVATKQLQVEKEQMDLEDAELDVEDAKLDVEDAEYALEDARLDVEDASLDVDDAEYALEDAKQDLEDAQSDLDEANSLSPVITAPFAGFITRINVEGGDEVLKGTVAVQLADPNKFEADIMVSEMDIMQVKLEGEAWVQVDAMSGMSLSATVTHIAPTATIQAGVVNYEVKVEVKSLEAVVQERQAVRQQAMADIAAGELPPPLQQAIDEGRITREEVEEMMKQGPPEGFTPPQVGLPVPEDFQLREGLTVTVSILVDESIDVLMVPNAAITTEGGQSYVQVVTASGETEQRAVQAGLSDWQFTEVTEGLSEGEQVLVPQGTSTTPTQSQRPGGVMMFRGGPPR